MQRREEEKAYQGSGVKDLVVALEVLVQLEDGGDVSTAITIVWGRPNRHDGVVEHELVALHDELVSPGDQIQTVGGVELRGEGEGEGNEAQQTRAKEREGRAK